MQPTRAGFYERNARKQHKLQGVKPDNLKRPSRQVTEEGETKTKVLSTVHCISCDGRKFQPNFEDLETYAQLSQDVKGLLPLSFTICATVSTPVVESYLNVFTLLGEDGDSFLANEIYLSEDNPNSVFYYYINGAYVSTSRSVPLIFPNQWVRSCLAASLGGERKTFGGNYNGNIERELWSKTKISRWETFDRAKQMDCWMDSK